MANPSYSLSDEVDFAGQRLKDLEVLRKYDRSKCRVLNLHNNMLHDLNDLPRFLFLTELIVSSNRLEYIPDLSFLPALAELDLSGNMIESVLSMPFLPGLKSLKLAYNCIKSLQGINGANVPNLEFLDIRENPISATEHNIQPISSLLHLTEISIAKNNLQIIALLFKTCSTLKYVDRKSQTVWREYAFKQKRQEQLTASNHQATERVVTVPLPIPPPPPLQLLQDPAVVATPHFDKVAAKYKRVSDRQHTNSPTPTHSPYPAGSGSAAERQTTGARTVRALLYSDRPEPPKQPNKHNEKSHAQVAVYEKVSSPSGNDFIQDASVSYLDESAQVTLQFDEVSREEHHRLLLLQAIVATADERRRCHKSRVLCRAFYRIRAFGDENYRNTAAIEVTKAHAHETDTLQQMNAKALKVLEESHHHDVASLKSEISQYDLKNTSLLTQIDALKNELESERDKSNVLKLSNSDLRHSHIAQQEHDSRVIEDLQRALQTAQAAEERLQEKQDITLRELENALSESSSTIEKLRLELSLTKDAAMQADNRVADLQSSIGALQYEKGELYAKNLKLEQQVGSEKNEISTQMELLREENRTLSTTLAVKGKESDHWQQEHSNALHKAEKLETRLRQLHSAFEALKSDHMELKTENAELKERESKNIQTLRTLAANVKKLQNILEMRDKNCEKCANYEEKLKKVLNERAEDLKLYERVRDSLQHTTDQLASAQAENRGNTEVVAELTRSHSERVNELQSKLDALQNRYKQLEQADTARRELLDKLQAQPPDNNDMNGAEDGDGHRHEAKSAHSIDPLVNKDIVAEVPLTGEMEKLVDKISKLQASLLKKDNELHESEEELHVLRDRFHQQSREFKECMRDCAELEKRYTQVKHEHQDNLYVLHERCEGLQNEVSRLQSEVKRRSDVEVKLNALIADFCKEDNSTTSVDVRKQLSFSHGVYDSDTHCKSNNSMINKANNTHSTGLDTSSTTATTTSHANAAAATTAATQRHSIYAGNDGQYNSPLPCVSLACLEERRVLHAQLAAKAQELEEEKERHSRLYMQKNEECARFAQALTQLESSSLTLSTNLKAEQERMELTMEKYRSDKRRLARQCESLKEQLSLKESEVTKSRVAMEQLQGAIANFQGAAAGNNN